MLAKYIVTLQKGLECIIIFPEIMNHREIAKNITGHSSNHIISAGFLRVQSDGNITCYGHSISIDKGPRKELDSQLAMQLLSNQ